MNFKFILIVLFMIAAYLGYGKYAEHRLEAQVRDKLKNLTFDQDMKERLKGTPL